MEELDMKEDATVITPEPPRYGAHPRYLGERGQAYSERRTRLRPANAARVAAAKFQSIAQPDDTVVDFGCGGGEILELLPGKRKVGIDINRHALKLARSRGVECYESMQEIEPGIADVVISHHALEHVPYPVQALREMRSSLKPGGVLALCVPIDDWRRHKTFRDDDVNQHLQTWTAQSLGNTLKAAGFSVCASDVRMRTGYAGRPLLALYPFLPEPVFRLAHLTWGVKRRSRELMAVVRA